MGFKAEMEADRNIYLKRQNTVSLGEGPSTTTPKSVSCCSLNHHVLVPNAPNSWQAWAANMKITWMTRTIWYLEVDERGRRVQFLHVETWLGRHMAIRIHRVDTLFGPFAWYAVFFTFLLFFKFGLAFLPTHPLPWMTSAHQSFKGGG